MTTTTTNQTTNQPADRVRLGSVQAAIWENEGPNGPFYSATIERSYRDGEEWKTTSSFGRDDLLVVSKICDQAHTRICDLITASRAAQANQGR